ncbi:MAG TPA: BamA/TamA family outer membrane protein [Gemmatimonadaceae bacterium]|nr:BamA/TamA family outer membrane protein [Gemmatimonadaceae bacterium]
MIRRLFLALALTTIAGSARAQALACDTGDLEIKGVEFTGNSSFRASELGNAIVTTPSSWARRVLGLPLGARHCLDSLELQRDAVRLRLFYRQRGYYKTAVEASVTPTSPGAVGAVKVGFAIDEGPPVIIDSLVVAGLDSVAPRPRELLERRLFALRGGVYNKLLLQTAIDSTVDWLQNLGYAHAVQPLRDITVDNESDLASIQLTFITGPLAHIGRVDFDLSALDEGHEPEIDSSTVRKLLSFHEGDLYRQNELLRTQRDLYALETYRRVNVDLLPDSLQPSDTSLTVAVRLGESRMYSMRLGAGWATLDCARTQARFTDRNFMGSARRLELNARLSHIGLCTGNVRDDPFSNRLNYFTSATLRLPALFGPRNIPSLTIFSERASEYRTYLRTTPIGGAAEITRDLSPRITRPGLPLTLGYQVEYGRTEAGQAVFCQLFNRCSVADIDRLQRNTSLQVVSAVLLRDRTNNIFDPSRGSQLHFEVRTGFTSVDTGGGSVFNRVLAEASVYQPTGARSVIAARLQAATVLEGFSLAGATSFVPPQQRLYAGGPNSVRGYSQNLLGPVVYIVDQENTFVDSLGNTVAGNNVPIRQFSPTGGNTLVIGNLEWRVRPPILGDALQFATFVDAGIVWNRSVPEPDSARGVRSVSLSDVRVTPGVGIRVNSPVGPFRVDIAYNPYPLSRGAVYFVGSDNALRCVISQKESDGGGSSALAGRCPPTFEPEHRGSFFNKLTFNFSIGQAF